MIVEADIQESELNLIAKMGDHFLRLKPGVRLYPQADSVDSYVVSDESGTHFFACDQNTFLLMSALDGRSPFSHVLEQLQFDSNCYQSLEIVIAKFIKHGLLSGFDTPRTDQKWWQSFKQPIAMKFPLFNPDRFLGYLSGFTGFVFSKYSLVLFLVLVCYSLYQLPLQWESIQLHWQSRFFDPMNGLLLAVAYLFLKSLHEVGHGLAVKKYGGNVRECGVFMLVFLPLPYVDTSASYIFPYRWQRVLVGAAGMWIELIIAMLAFILWQHAASGYGADFLFNLVFVGSVSTLIFNLNPLMRFDGYYILSDCLGVFNLNARSREVLGRFIKRIFFRVDKPDNSGLSTLKQSGLMLYALCAIPYRLFVGLVIALYLSGKFFVFGTLLALWVLVQMLVFPLMRMIVALFKEAREIHQVKRFLVLMLVLVGASFTLLFWVNFNFSNSQVAMVIEPEYQQVNSTVDGVVTSLEYRSGERVEKGATLVTLDNPELALQLLMAQGLLSEYKAQYRLEGLNNITEAQSWQEKIAIQNQEIALLHQRIAGLKLTAPIAGELVLPRDGDLLGRYVTRGSTIARVFSPNQVTVWVVISEEQVRKLRYGIDAIEVRFNAVPDKTYVGSLLRIKPAAQSELPSRFMGSSAGGMVAVDGRDELGVTSVSPFFLVEVLVEKEHTDYLPAMGMVRFIYKQMTVADYLLVDIYHAYIQSLR
jgi:putative peptide zinc metalloprotease protein